MFPICCLLANKERCERHQWCHPRPRAEDSTPSATRFHHHSHFLIGKIGGFRIQPAPTEYRSYPLAIHSRREQTKNMGVSWLLFVTFASQRCPNGGGKPIRCLPGRGHCTIQDPLSRVVRQGRPAPDHMVEGLIARQLIRREQARRAVFVALCNLQASVQ